MTSVFATLSSLGVWNWFIVAGILMALETLVPGVHFVWFGISAAIIGVFALLVGAVGGGAWLPWQTQVIAFALIAVAVTVWVRRVARPDRTQSDLPDLNARSAQYVGRVFTVAEPIAGGRGKVKVGDTLWAAEGPDTPVGTLVRVTGARGVVLVVERA